MSYMDSQWPVCKLLQGDMQGLYDIDNELPVRNGLLYRSDQLVVQKSLRPNILQHTHRGHFGMTLVNDDYVSTTGGLDSTNRLNTWSDFPTGRTVAKSCDGHHGSLQDHEREISYRSH